MIKLSIEEYYNDIEKFVEGLKNHFYFGKCAGVHGKPRGGLFLAQVVSHKLDLPYLHNPPFLSYWEDKNWLLVVDDVCESGSTFSILSEQYRPYQIRFGCLYRRHSSKFNPDYVQRVLETDDWIVFPYEKEVINETQEIKEHYNKDYIR